MPLGNEKTKTELEIELKAAKKRVAELEQKVFKKKTAIEENRLLEVLQEAPIGLFRSTTDGKLIHVNNTLARLFGYATPDEMIQQVNAGTIEDILYKIPHQRSQIVRDTRYRGIWRILENNFKCKDGTPFTAKIYIRSVAEPGVLEGFIEDITEQKRIEASLQIQNSYYQAVFENTGSAKIIIKNDTIISQANRQFEILSGESKEEIENRKSWTEYFHEEDVTWMLDQHRLRRKNADAALIYYESRFIDCNGTEKNVLVNVSVIPGTDLSVASLLDITERKQAEIALRESERKYRFLADNTLECLWKMNSDLEFTYINPAIERLTGFTPQEWIGTRLKDHCDEQWYKKIVDVIEEEYAHPSYDGRGRIFETVIRHRSGARIPVEIIGRVVFDENANPAGLQGTIRDIRERKQAEQNRRTLEARLRHSQKMEAVGTLGGGIAHEFNNMLTSILGFTELAISEVEAGTDLAGYLQQIQASGIRARDLVKQILTFSRQTKPEMIPLEVRLLAKQVLNLLRSTLPPTIKIEEHLDSASHVMCDPAQIHQIILNLCTNAVQAIGEQQGILRVRMEEVDLTSDSGLSAAGPHIRICIEDSGPGIPKELMDKIFDPFFTTKPQGQGTGLGLSMTHGIIENHNGFIHVDSELEKGTVFKVYLPVIEEACPESITGHSVPTGSERILFVDDEQPITSLQKKILERTGYNLESTTSSTEALEIFSRTPDAFDLLITDLTMPRMNGIELALAVKKIRPDLPIILCSGHIDMKINGRAAAAGISEFVLKPVSRCDMAQAIRRVLDKNRNIANNSGQKMPAGSNDVNDSPL